MNPLCYVVKLLKTVLAPTGVTELLTIQASLFVVYASYLNLEHGRLRRGPIS